MSVPYLAQAADQEQLEWLGGGIMRIMLDSDKTGGQLTVMRSATGPSASPVHVHDVEDEIVVLLRGSGIFWVGDQRWELAEGGVAYLPSKVPHAYRFTALTVDILSIITPPGTQEDFMRAAGWDLSRPKPDGWEITPASLASAAAATGQAILGPPLAADQTMPHAYLTGQQAR